MARPGDEMAAGSTGRGRLRASHAEREQVIEVLKVAFVQDRLTRDELDARVGQAFTSQTYAELVAVIADIPSTIPLRQPIRPPARPPVNTDVRAGVRAIAALYLTAAILWLGALLAGDNALGGAAFFLAFMVSVVAVFFSLYGAVVLLDSKRHKHSGRQLPADANRCRL